MTGTNDTIALGTFIACQRCGHQIELTEALAQPFLERSMSGARREIELLRTDLESANAKEAQLQAAQAAIALEKNQLQLTISEQVNEQLTAVRAAVAGQYEEQIDKQKRAQQDEVASLKLLVDTANAKEAEFQAARVAMELEKNQLQLTISAQVNEQLATVKAVVADQYQEQIDNQKKVQQEEVASLKHLVDAANAKEAEFANRLRQRNLEIEQREQNLIAKQDQMESDYLGKWEAKRTELIQQGMLHAEHKIHLRLTEKNILIEQLQGKIKELETTAFQGSQQVQGEAFEREVENRLRRHFPWDKFLPVSTGSYGADLVQSIYSNQGETSGKIIWECKNTKHWSQDWLKKVKQDQQNENAQAAVIVSVALPDSVRNFDLLEDVWVCSPEYFIELATAIRFYLCEVFAMRNFNKDKDIKNELLFSYVTGQQFRAKFKAIIEVQKELRQGLEKEKKAMSAAWSKRDKQLDLLLTGAAGIGGDLLGILGKTFRPIEELELEDADTRLIESSYDEPLEKPICAPCRA